MGIESEEFDDLRDDVTELKITIAGMKPHVEQIPSIAKSLSILAEIMPQLKHNMEEHQHIHARIDVMSDSASRIEKQLHARIGAVNTDTENLEKRLHVIEIDHAACMAKNEINDRRSENSTWNLIRKAAIPIIVSVTLAFLAWMVITHLPEYQKALNAKPAAAEAKK